MHSPVLMLVFSRPDTTQRVFEVVRAARPARLYVAADGAREDRPGEAGRCEAVRQICANVDWPCEVKTLYRDSNLGCKKAVSSALDWFFEAEEQGIILEDDIVPDPSFFPYCDELLERYRDDPEIAIISGFNAISDVHDLETSYGYTRYAHVWGFATWRRVWTEVDLSMSSWPEASESGFLGTLTPRVWGFQKHWSTIFSKTFAGGYDSWAYPLQYHVLRTRSLCVYPGVLLARNVGFGEDGTHTQGDSPDYLAAERVQAMAFPMRAPSAKTLDARVETLDSIISFGVKPHRTWRLRLHKARYWLSKRKR